MRCRIAPWQHGAALGMRCVLIGQWMMAAGIVPALRAKGARMDKGEGNTGGTKTRRGRKPRNGGEATPSLRVVAGIDTPQGERVVPLMAGRGRNADGLTAQQEAFAQAIAAGAKSQSDAYRSAYDTAGMKPETVQNEASRLMARPEIAARVNAIVAAKQAQALHDAGETRRLVTRELLARISDPKNPPAVQLRALELLGKTVAMFTDRVEEAPPGADQGADAVQDALEARLAKLLQAG